MRTTLFLKSILKFFIKTKIISPLRSLLLNFIKTPVEKEGFENRLLIINLEALGDLIVFTSVLKHYRRAFPDKKIYLLMKKGLGLEAMFQEHFVDHVITVDYSRFAGNPFYSARFINSLRRIGFSEVINHDFSAAEIMGKIIGVELEAPKTVAYEGLDIEWRDPFDIQQRLNLKIVREKIFPRYTKIIPGIDKGVPQERLKSAVSHYIAIYEAATGHREEEYAPQLFLNEKRKEASHLPTLALGRYVVLNVSASVAYKRWSFLRFSKIVEWLLERELRVVLVGGRSDLPVVHDFLRYLDPVLEKQGKVFNLVGRTTLDELFKLVHESALVVTNDTSLVHVAVALKKASVCVTGGGQFGMFAYYGYPRLNRWAIKRSPCYFDSWSCGLSVREGEAAPCLREVPLSRVQGEIEAVLQEPAIPLPLVTEFSPEFDTETRSPEKKYEVVYAGLRHEEYNAKQGSSFEYRNFYESLKKVYGEKVLECAYDPIIRIGRKKFNKEMLDIVRTETPRYFLSFMYTDEWQYETLEAIKKLTTSFAWFADDHWRLDNYSRFYAPHFTWAVTTWSLAPQRYAYYGIQNVIRSQWASNPELWKPIKLSRDIEVSFIGQRNARRAVLIEELKKRGIHVWVRGWGWREGKLSQKEMIEAFSRSKINLNFSEPPENWRLKILARLFMRRSLNRIVISFAHPISNWRSWRSMVIPQIKARPFEVLACRTFLLSSYADDLENYYKEGKEIAYYHKDIDELAEKIRYYLNHEEEREKIAAAGYERTLQEHTYEKRFAEIFNDHHAVSR